ncbi:hypothetical protein [Stutzerimonas nitrititolerans]|uniref:hypothetical protein n=1 Tax=Stutzerimonas nitrititolerans TaxID=2482751 RepID=UPI0028AC5564|nr:hypothetical protein [Stutzerimonas nitrititolerans]
MESRRGLLISIQDMSHLTNTGCDKITRLVADLLSGADMRLISSQILLTTCDMREAANHERIHAELQLDKEQGTNMSDSSHS